MGMVGTKGCSGGYRPGAGRRPGSYSIKKDVRKGKKKVVKVADAPSAASVSWFMGMVKEAGRKAAEDKAERLAAALARKAAHSC